VTLGASFPFSAHYLRSFIHCLLHPFFQIDIKIASVSILGPYVELLSGWVFGIWPLIILSAALEAKVWRGGV
jgi:hypothetical protein